MAKQNEVKAQVVVLGSGPGGYAAAFRAADLGLQVVLVERYETIGGVCLNVGCIPSKALLHAAKVLEEVKEMSESGISFGKPKIDTKKLVGWKDSVVGKLTGGLKMLAKQRNVQIVHGFGVFADANTLEVTSDKETTVVKFEQAVIAAGSLPVNLPFIPEDPRIFDSTGALTLPSTQGEMLVIGGGIIGLEMATVYEALGMNMHVVELSNQIIPGADKDLIMPLMKRLKKSCNIMLETKVTAVEAKKDGIYVTFEGKNAPDKPQKFDQVLVAVGRRPNSRAIGLDKAGVNVSEQGFINVDKQMRTNVQHIFAIGDIVGQPMLAHKATHEGHVAAEAAAGLKHQADWKCIPSVAYTDPEVAFVGVSELEAKAQGIEYEKGVFPWAASGRSLAIGRDEGFTKLIIDKNTRRVIGAGIVGTSAGDFIGEVALAIEMGCDVEDIALTIHPHPTLGETIGLAAEVLEGTVTDLYVPKKKAKAKA